MTPNNTIHDTEKNEWLSPYAQHLQKRPALTVIDQIDVSTLPLIERKRSRYIYEFLDPITQEVLGTAEYKPRCAARSR